MSQSLVWSASADAAAALLRRVPARTWILWALTTLPLAYLLGRLLLAASFDAYYPETSGLLALAVALGYLWKQVGEALFQRDLLRLLGAEPPPLRLGPQLTLQPTALIVLPLAALLFFPLAPAVTFYRTLSLTTPRQALRHAVSNVLVQSWELSIVFAGGLLLAVNLFVLWLAAPMLLRAFFGWETSFGRIEERLFNLPSFFVVTLLTYLALDPLLNAMAARRVFLAEAKTSGVDLLAALRVLTTALLLAIPLAAQEGPQIEQSIQQTMREPGFAFRQPRDLTPEQIRDNWFLTALRSLARWIEELLEWLKPQQDTPTVSPPSGLSPQLTQNLIIALAVLGVLALAYYFYRNRRPAQPVAPRTAPPTPPDLTREDLRPDALPEASWLSLADEYAAAGDYRLSLRALHLAGLRRLGERNLISIAAAKSGGEYSRELERRSRSTPNVFPLFKSNLRSFEEAWYGFHELNLESLAAVRQYWEEIRTHVG